MEPHWGSCITTVEPASRTFGYLTKAALSSDGSVWAVTLDGVIQVYETSKWSVIGALYFPDRSDRQLASSPHLAFSADGRRLAVAWWGWPNDTTQIWNWETRIRTNSLTSFGGGPQRLRFCSNDEQLAHFDDSALGLVNITTNQVARETSLEPFFEVTKIQENGRMDINVIPGDFELARIIAGQSLCYWSGEIDDTADEATIAFSSHGELMARTLNKILQLFRVHNGRNLATIVTEYGSNSGHTTDLKFFDGDRRLAHVIGDGKLYIWTVEPLEFAQTVRIYAGGLFQVMFLDQRRQMISFGSEAGSISVWDMSHPTMLQFEDSPQELVYRMRIWPSLSRMVAISSNGELAIWDTRNAFCVRSVHLPTNARGEEGFNMARVEFMEMATNQQRLVFGDGGSLVRVWDLGMRPQMRVLVAPTNDITFKAISPNGAFLVFEMDRVSRQELGTIHIVDTRHQVAAWSATCFTVFGYNDAEFIFSDDGGLLVTYAKEHLHIWRFSTEWERIRVFAAGDFVHSFALSPDGGQIAVSHRTHRIKVWDATTASDDPIIEIGESRKVIELYKPALLFSKSGKFLCLRSTGEPGLKYRCCPFWDGELHDSYTADPKTRYPYNLKWYNVSSGKLELEHMVETAPTTARPVEVEDEGGFLVQTAYGIQKCGPTVQTLTYDGYGMSEDRIWILKGSTRVLFVPPAYRVKRPRIVDSVAILRHSTHILLLRLK